MGISCNNFFLQAVRYRSVFYIILNCNKKLRHLTTHLVKRIQHVHVERALVVAILGLGPLLGGRIEVVLTPQTRI